MTETPFHAENAFSAPNIALLKRHPKRIVFPEAEDPRVLRVAQELVQREISVPILLGKKQKIRALAKEHDISLDFVGLIDPETSSEFPLFCDRFARIERYQGLQVNNPQDWMRKPHYYAAMMVQYGNADGIVGGNQMMPALFLRSLLQMIKPLPHCDDVASCLVLVDQQNPLFGDDGILFLADCAVIPDPSVEQLAMIAVETARAACSLLRRKVHVAMLGYANRSDERESSPHKITAARELARQRAKEEMIDLEIDGELQADVALLPEAAERKGVHSLVAGKADVIIFPDLHSANIASKLLILGARPQVYGHLVLGLSKPAAQLSRAATTESILGTAVAVGVEAIKYRELVMEDHLV